MDVRDRVVREPERRKITGVSSTTAWRGEKDGTFPKRIRLGTNSVGWRLSELLAWVKSRQTCTAENTRPVAVPMDGKRRGRKPKNNGGNES